jgi:hypothetical protein
LKYLEKFQQNHFSKFDSLICQTLFICCLNQTDRILSVLGCLVLAVDLGSHALGNRQACRIATGTVDLVTG